MIASIIYTSSTKIKKSQGSESDRGPAHYEGAALPLSYFGARSSYRISNRYSSCCLKNHKKSNLRGRASIAVRRDCIIIQKF